MEGIVYSNSAVSNGINYRGVGNASAVGRPTKAFVLMPEDIWFEVIDYLPVIDVVHFRGVNRKFARIISSSVVWKRLLRKIRAPLPYQPTAIKSLSAKATEAMIRRALLLDINWQRISPIANTRILTSNERPYLVRILSGGRYAVAATKSSEDSSFAVCVWDLENPEERGGGCALLAKCRTRTAVSQLVAKYMYHQGQQGIAVATLRSIGEKPATKTEVCVVHISLACLEKLSKDEDLGGDLPFQLVELHKARCQIAYMNIEGNTLSVVHRPRTLMLFQLGTKKQSQLKLQNPQNGHRHSIQGCKIIPFQNQVLVIRLIYADDHTSYAFEIYSLPPWDAIVKEPPPLQQQVFEEVAASSFSISEIITRQPNHDHPTEDELNSNCHFAAPISIFANTMRPKGIIHWQITPKLVPLAATTSIVGTNPMGLSNVVPNLISHNPAFPTPAPPPSVMAATVGAAPAPGLTHINLFAPLFGAPQINLGPPWTILPAGANPFQIMPGHPGHLGLGATQPSLPAINSDLDLAMVEEIEDPGPLTPHYQLPATRLAHYWFEENDQKPAVSAGADRSVFWTRPLENRADFPPMRNLLGYSSKAPGMPIGYSFTGAGAGLGGGLGAVGSTDGDVWGLLPPNMDGNTDGHGNAGGLGGPGGLDGPTNGPDDRRLKQLSLPAEFVEAVQHGTQSVAFDESSGKLCIVAGKPTRLYLLDYAC